MIHSNVKRNIQFFNNLIPSSDSSHHINPNEGCVLYITSLSVVRKTFDDSNAMKSILTLNHIKYELRDIYVYEEFKFELKKRMNGEMVIPSLFVGGVFYGDLNAIQSMNEIGTLTFNLINFIDRQSNNSLCPCCGGANFIPCSKCFGSKKSSIRHFIGDSIALRCSHCNSFGIIKCLLCSH